MKLKLLNSKKEEKKREIIQNRQKILIWFEHCCFFFFIYRFRLSIICDIFIPMIEKRGKCWGFACFFFLASILKIEWQHNKKKDEEKKTKKTKLTRSNDIEVIWISIRRQNANRIDNCVAKRSNGQKFFGICFALCFHQKK